MDLQTPLAPTTLDCAVAYHQWEIERLYRAYTQTPNPSPSVPAPIPSSAREDTPALPSPPAPVMATPTTRSWYSQTQRIRTSSASEQTDPVSPPAPTSNPPPPAPIFCPPQPAPTSSPPTPAPSASPPLPALTPVRHTSASPEVAAISILTPPPEYVLSLDSTSDCGYVGLVSIVVEDCERGEKGVKVKECIDERGWTYVVDEVVSGSVLGELLVEGDRIIDVNGMQIGVDNEPLQLMEEAEGYLCIIVEPQENTAVVIPSTPIDIVPSRLTETIPPSPAASIPPTPADSIPPTPAASVSSTTVGSFWDFEDLLPFAISATKRKKNISRLFSFR